MYKAVPPLQEMFNMAGMDLPSYLKGKDISAEEATDSIETGDNLSSEK
jgi:flotillin